MEQDKIIKDAQYRKGLSIAFFNATNAAMALVPIFQSSLKSMEDTKDFIRFARDWFLEEHKNYYATVIANVGVNYVVRDTLEKLNNCKNLEELKSTWLSLSEDERRDGEILKVKEELKNKYEKN